MPNFSAREQLALGLRAGIAPIGEFIHVSACRSHLAGSIRHRDTHLMQRHCTAHYSEIMEIKRTRADPHADFPRPRIASFSGGDNYLVEASSGHQLNGSDIHGWIRKKKKKDAAPDDNECRRVQ